MSPVAEVALVAARELRKNLRSAKGLLLLALSALGGTAVAHLMARSLQQKLAGLSPEEIRATQEGFITQLTNDPATGKYLATAPLPLIEALMLSIWLAPLVIALIGFDAMSADLQHRTVRFWTIRTRRTSHYVGKFVGVWASVSAITLCMNLLMWIAQIGGAYSIASILTWGFGFWLVTLPISAAWCGIATFVGSFFRSPPLSLLVTFTAFFAVWLLGFAVAHAADVRWLLYVYPNFYDEWLMSPHPEKVAGAVGICAGGAALFTAAGAFAFAKRDV